MSRSRHEPAPRALRVALDAMGSDAHPGVEIQAACAARRRFGIEAVLVGDEPLLAAEARRLGVREELDIRHTSEALRTCDSPTEVLRRRQASLAVAVELVASGEADAIVSAGNSGAVLVAAVSRLGKVGGIERPAIAAEVPTLRGPALLADAGANVSCRPPHLVAFARAAALAANVLYGRACPRVGLLSNGTEPGKGTDLTRAAFSLLERSSLRFIGYVEPNQIPQGVADVLVTDGFTGNAVLKTMEGVGDLAHALLARAARDGIAGRLGLRLARGALRRHLVRALDYETLGGAPVLGVGGVVVAAHGRSGPEALTNAIGQAVHLVRAELPSRLGELTRPERLERAS